MAQSVGVLPIKYGIMKNVILFLFPVLNIAFVMNKAMWWIAKAVTPSTMGFVKKW